MGQNNNVNDDHRFLWYILSFIIPIIGIIIAVIWWSKQHSIAVGCLISALISMGIALLIELSY